MKYLDNFIIVDDDKINNKLCRHILEKEYPQSAVTDFTDPEAGLQYLEHTYTGSAGEESAILLLDVMMPTMDAWEFLTKFEGLSEPVRKRVKVFILSSSIDKRDMARAHEHPCVEYYLIKPLTKESVKLLVHLLQKRHSMSRP